jgi:hypothetical protein
MRNPAQPTPQISISLRPHTAGSFLGDFGTPSGVRNSSRQRNGRSWKFSVGKRTFQQAAEKGRRVRTRERKEPSPASAAHRCLKWARGESMLRRDPPHQNPHRRHPATVEPMSSITPWPRDANASAAAAYSIPGSLPPLPPPTVRRRPAGASSGDDGLASLPRPEGSRRRRSRQHAT